MSRLADLLAEMDREPAPLPGVGAMAGLPREAPPPRKWRRATPFVMLAVMTAIATGALLSLPRSGPVAPPAAAPGLPAADAPAAAAPVPAQVRFRELMSAGLERARTGAYAEAAALFQQAVELDGGQAEAWNNLGVVLVRLGDGVKGVQAFRRALGVSPEHADAHRNLGAALDRQGKSAEALRHYRAYLSLAPSGHAGRTDVQRRAAEMAAARSPE